MKVTFLLCAICLLLASAPKPTQAQNYCGTGWEPCCPWWDQSVWQDWCWPDWQRPQPQPEPEPPPVILVTAITQAEKDVYNADADKFATAVKYFTFIAANARQSPDMVLQLVSKLATAAAIGSQLAEFYLRAAANDPWDDDYLYVYDAPTLSAGELSLEYCSEDGTVTGYCNWFIETMRWMARNGDGAYVSLNRSGTCEQVSGSDCAERQAILARDYLRLMGDAMRNAGWILTVLRDEFYANPDNDVYSPECDCSISGALDAATLLFWDSGYFSQNLP